MADGGSRRLLSATALMASGTMVSRVLGLVRAILITFVLGNGTLRAEIFTLAMTVPNSLYMLLAGGTLNNVLVPQIVRAVLHDEDKGKAFVDRIMTGFLILLGSLTVILTIAVPSVMSLYSASTWRTEAMADHWQALLLMSFITMPQLFFYGVFFLIGQILNARDSFGPMMWAPIANNVVSIGVFACYLAVWGSNATRGATFTTAQVWLLGAGSTLGIIVQTAILIPYLRRVGFSYRPRFDLKGTGLGRTFHIAKWMVGYVALTSLAQVVVTQLASTATPIDPATGIAVAGAGITVYQNAYLIWILPHSLVTVSLATAMLPSASRAYVAGDLASVATETSRAVRLGTTFLVPAAFAFLALADPATRLIYGNGQGGDDYHFVAWALMGFAIGLVPFTIQYLYLRAFYALDNTRTPFLLQIAISGANAALAVALVLPFGSRETVAARLALAYSLAYWLGAFITHRTLARRLPDLAAAAILRHLGRVAIASVPAALLAWLAVLVIGSDRGLLFQLLGLAAGGLLGLVSFFIAARLLGIEEAASLTGLLRRRRAATSSEPEAALGAESEMAAETQLGIISESGPTAAEATELLNEDPDGIGQFVPVQPDPGPPSELSVLPEPTSADLDLGTVPGLGDRFELTEVLVLRPGLRILRGHDLVLERPVLVHQLVADDPRGPSLADAGRLAAAATDSRFLRVLDVVDPEPGHHGAAVVQEYSSGVTLQQLLGDGPLTAAETAWLTREVSDALIELHEAGLSHGRLDPSQVVVTGSGNVKILGLLIGAALSPETPAVDDTFALGLLLYACLTARWPQGEAFGLAAAPLDVTGRPVSPSLIRPAVAPAVETVTSRILEEHPARGAGRLTTAAQITDELTLVLGPTSAAADLRRRVGNGDGPLQAPLFTPPVPTPARPVADVETLLDDEAGELTGGLLPTGPVPARPFTPVPPPATKQATVPASGSPRRRLVLLLAIAALVAAILWLVVTHPWGDGGSALASPASSASALAISEVKDFDPKADGGSGAENRKQVERAVDGDPTTAWRTERYRKLASFGGLKPGVGLILDLGETRTVSEVRLGLEGEPVTAEIRVPAKESPDSAPTRSASLWRTVATTEKADSTLTFAHEQTRFVLVYLTSLPPHEDDYFRGGIEEVEVIGWTS